MRKMLRFGIYTAANLISRRNSRNAFIELPKLKARIKKSSKRCQTLKRISSQLIRAWRQKLNMQS